MPNMMSAWQSLAGAAALFLETRTEAVYFSFYYYLFFNKDAKMNPLAWLPSEEPPWDAPDLLQHTLQKTHQRSKASGSSLFKLPMYPGRFLVLNSLEDS